MTTGDRRTTESASPLTELNLIYTLCFLTRGDQVLMLYRYRPPNQSLWNGVGGRIEPGESPLQSCLREVAEETGYRPPAAHFRGILTWRGLETPDAGLYLFTAPAPEGDPQPCAEGILQWHPLEWVLSAPEVVSNLHICGPHIFSDGPPRLFHFEYQAGLIIDHAIERLPKGSYFKE